MWKDTVIFNQINKVELANKSLEIRVARLEAMLCRALEVEPEGVESVITLVDLQQIDEVKNS